MSTCRHRKAIGGPCAANNLLDDKVDLGPCQKVINFEFIYWLIAHLCPYFEMLFSQSVSNFHFFFRFALIAKRSNWFAAICPFSNFLSQQQRQLLVFRLDLIVKLAGRRFFPRNHFIRNQNVTSKFRNLSSSSSTSVPPVDHPEWVLFYRFKHIVVLRFLTRIKIYQTGITALIAAWSIHRFNREELEMPQLIFYSGICLFAVLMLVLIGNVARRVVGIAYHHRSRPDLVKLAHMSFWGRRADRVFELKEFSPLSDTNVKPDAPFLRLETADGKNYFWLSKRFAFYDREKFTDIFGNP